MYGSIRFYKQESKAPIGIHGPLSATLLLMQTTSNPLPVRVINENVSQLEVAKYYLKVEFAKLFPDASVETIQSGIDNLNDTKILPLLEAISFTFHLNGVHQNITRTGFIWKEEEWDVSQLVMTGMDPNVNKVIFNPEVNGDSIKFKNYLLKYFDENTETDPEGLFSYKPSKREIHFPKLIMNERMGKILMLDGSHRLTEMLLNGVKTVRAYVGHPTGEIQDDDQKIRVGDSTYILMTIAYKKGTAAEKEAVLTVVKQLVSRSIDGKEAIQKYWIDRQRDEEIKKAGKEILDNL